MLLWPWERAGRRREPGPDAPTGWMLEKSVLLSGGGHQVAARSSRQGGGLTCKMCPPRCCSKTSETNATGPLWPGAADTGRGEAGACW